MLAKTCTLPRCTKPHAARGWCAAHYAVWKKYGDVNHQVRTPEMHGLHRHPTYFLWRAIKSRTQNKNNNKYSYYGGRGIKMCEGWEKSFLSFYTMLGEKPSPAHTVDRINNDGNYSCGSCTECKESGWPMNVKWSTMSEQQANNRLIRSNNTIGYRGVRKGNGKFIARIHVNRVEIYIGRYNTLRDAVIAYNRASLEYRGKNALQNPVPN